MAPAPSVRSLEPARVSGPEGLERPVVTGAEHRAEHGGIEPPARETPGVDRASHQLDGLGGDRDRRARVIG